MTVMAKQYFTRADLRARGWSKRMIALLLDRHDTRLPVNHWANYAGAAAYDRSRVFVAEATQDFSVLFNEWASRTKADDAVREKYRKIWAADRPEGMSLIHSGQVWSPKRPVFAFDFDKLIRSVSKTWENQIWGLRLRHYWYGRSPGSTDELMRLSMLFLIWITEYLDYGIEVEGVLDSPWNMKGESINRLCNRFASVRIPDEGFEPTEVGRVVRFSQAAARYRRHYTRKNQIISLRILQAVHRGRLRVEGGWTGVELPDILARNSGFRLDIE